MIHSMFTKLLAVLFLMIGTVNLTAKPAATLPTTTLNLVKFHKAVSGEDVVLVNDGKPAATIVIPQNDTAIDTAKLAAKEFAEHIKLATGAELPVVTDQANPSGTLVLIGESRISREAGITNEKLPPEGFRVMTFKRGLAIVGYLPKEKTIIGNQGTLFGVYDFLERYLGIRWYYPGNDGRIVPKTTSLVVGPINYTDAPVRSKRTLQNEYSARRSPGFPADVDFNLHWFRYRIGMSTPIRTACHTPTNFKIHFADNPECFALQVDGKRNSYMPCYGNPKTAELFIQDLENFYTKGDSRPWSHGGALWHPPTAEQITVSPPDMIVDCHCEYCKKLIEPQANKLGRTSRLMTLYTERVAKEVAKRWPEKKVFFLPYSNFTLPPKGIKLPKNVVIGLCLMYGTANEKEPEIAAIHDAMIKDWGKIAPGHPVHLWEYECWPADDTLMPYQFPHVVQSLQQRHRTDIAGSFVNAFEFTPPELTGETWASRSWTMYCWFRLLWNPDFNVDAAFDEYVTLMYGPAREPMADILTTLTDRWEKVRWSVVPEGHHIAPKAVHEETMPRSEVVRLKKVLAKARSLAPEGTVERRRLEFFAKSLELFFQESDDYHGEGNLPTLSLLKIGLNPKIDGKLNEPCWRDADKQMFKKGRASDAEPIKGDTATYVQGVWTDSGVTLAFTMEETEKTKLSTSCTQQNIGAIWCDDGMEIMLDAEGQRTDFSHMMANSVTFSTAIPATHEWKPQNLQVKAEINEKNWILEIFIPYSDLEKIDKPKVGTIWYGNFIRNRPNLKSRQAEYQRWSTRERPANRDIAAFGRIRFVE